MHMLPMTMTKYESVPMTPGRRMDLLEELATTCADRDRLVRFNADVQKKAKEIVKARESRISELTDQLALGTESVGRDMNLEYNLLNNTTLVKDAKSGELIEERAMTAKERQAILDESDAQPEYLTSGRGKKR